MSEIRDEMEAAYTASEDSSPSAPESSPAEAGDVAVTADTSAPVVDVAAPLPSDTGVATPSTPGPIPFDRHKAVLEETRAKYAWADKYGTPETAQQRLAVTEWMERDPVGFLRTYAANQGIDPQTLFPQTLFPQAQRPAPAPDPDLEVDVLFENGQTTFTGDKVKQLLAMKEQQIMSRVEQELAPIKQERAVTQLQLQARSHAQQQLQVAATWPGFQEHEEDLKGFLKANPTATLHDAYINVVPAKLAARIEAEKTASYQRALTDLQTKAGAASIPAPRTSGASALDTSAMTIRQALEAAYEG